MASRETTGLIVMTVAFLAVMVGVAGFVGLQMAWQGGSSGSSGSGGAPLPRGSTSPTAVLDQFIRDNPNDPTAYVQRANIYRQSGDLGWAIDDYTMAMDLGANTAEVYFGRGEALEGLGDDDLALADYDRVIELDATHREALNARAQLQQRMGDLHGAAEDLRRVATLTDSPRELGALVFPQWGVLDYEGALLTIQRQHVIAPPATAHAHMTLGVTHYHLGELAAAEESLLRAVARRQDGRVYAHFYLWLVRARAGNRDSADATLREFFSGSGARVQGNWPPRIAAFILGDITEAQFLQDAAAGEWLTPSEQLCEACFYAGSLRLLEGDGEAAAMLFQRSVDTGQTRYYEYNSAQKELSLLEGHAEAPGDEPAEGAR